MTQTEAQLEASLVRQLDDQGYERVSIPDEAALTANLKSQLEKHNNTLFTDKEFAQILNSLNDGNVFKRANILRGRCKLQRDDGKVEHIQFLNTAEWCQNCFQVTSQITQQGRRENRYDVTILINGLPLVHIELKRRGIEMAEAFNQINRYHRDSFKSGYGLFQYVQIFVISNGVNTKYFANQRKQTSKQTFFWADEKNKIITDLSKFAATFLAKCHIAKMICRHTVLHETNKIPMVLRPYQVYAVEKIVERMKNTKLGGYIWHTTGSGKTLTSFKAAQLITAMPEIEKVVFVVDRIDLDDQTMREFNAYQKGSVDGSSNTVRLVEHFAKPETKLVVTTIQKLSRAIQTPKHMAVMEAFKDKRIVLIFDECHRSQFGTTHQRITEHFKKAQLFGFTGTPIFKENAITGATDSKGQAVRKRTTADLFGDRLHQYIITDAIRDGNVLQFMVEYWGKLRHADGSLKTEDELATGIDRKEFFESTKRVGDICNWIIANHDKKTHNRNFTSILAVGSINAACKYYDRLKELKEQGKHDLRVVTIFSSPVNEDDPEATGELPADLEDPEDIEAAAVGSPAREKMDQYIKEYNDAFGTGFDTRKQGGFYNYYRDIGKRIKSHDKEDFKKENRIDILLVVNMFLTGFDAIKLNTMYVDKRLQQHGLIQAYSRTNRIFDAQKSHGNIVCFRNLKKATDDAIKLFSSKGVDTSILLDPYEDYVKEFNKKTIELLQIAPTPQSVNDLADEDAKFAFIKAFRQMMRTMNILKGFSEFDWGDLTISEQTYADYRSKYLDLYDEVRQSQEVQSQASILDEVDFEISLIRRDEINVRFILKLLQDAPKPNNDKNKDKRKDIRNRVLTLLEGEVQLRSKRKLIEQFIEEYWDGLEPVGDIFATFEKFWTEKREQHLKEVCKEERLDKGGVENLIAQYRFTNRVPLGKEITELMEEQPGILERRDRINSASAKIMETIEIFDDAGV